MTDLERRTVAPEVAEPADEPRPRWIWDDEGFTATPFAIGSVAVALLFFGAGVLVLGFQFVSALLSR